MTRILVGLLVVLVGATVARAGKTHGQIAHGIGYVREEAPEPKIPAVKGRSYEARVPATIDLQEQADLALNALTRVVDPEYDYEAYEVGVFHFPSISKYLFANHQFDATKTQGLILPPFLLHSYHGYNGAHPKMMEAIALLRLINGNDAERAHVEDEMVKTMLHMWGPEDGQYYMAIKGRPWALSDEWGSFLAHTKPPKNVAHIAALWPSGRALQTLCVYALREPDNPLWREYLDVAMKGLDRMIVKKDDWGYFPGDLLYLDEKGKRIAYAKSSYGGRGEAHVTNETPPTTGLNALSLTAPTLYGVSRYYKISGSPVAKELAQRLAKYILDHAEALDPETGKFIHHFHLNTATLLALLEYATAFNDKKAQDQVLKSYEWAKTLGVAELGYWPESLGPECSTSEGCGVGDMVALAVGISRAGIADRWDDADRFIRNHFVEAMLSRSDWVADFAKQGAPGRQLTVEETNKLTNIPGLISAEEAAERSVGTFSSCSRANDWILEGMQGWTGCCLGNGARAIFYAWNGILDYDKDANEVTVNLLMNRASPWADVDSYLPYEGKIKIRMKKTARLKVRIPQWVDMSKVDVSREWVPGPFFFNKRNSKFTVDGRYLNLGEAKAGQVYSINFPMVTRTQTITPPFPHKDPPTYTFTFKGNDAVDVQPAGKNCPLYQREAYRGDKAKFKKIRRFCAEDLGELGEIIY